MHDRRRPLLVLVALLATGACLAPAAGAAGPRAGYVTSVVGASLLPFDAFGGPFGAPFSFGSSPWGVAISPDGATAWVSQAGADIVIPVDTATNMPGAPIPVGQTPRTIGITPDGTTAYVANLGSRSVTPIDTATNTAGPPIAVGSGPHGIAIAPDGSRVYVANLFSNSVSVIDTATDAVVATVPAGRLPYTLAITPNGATVYATNINSSDVYAIDTVANTAQPIPVGAGTFGVAVSPDGATAYVSTSDLHGIVPIDTATNAPGALIPVGSSPEGIAITPDGSTAWVTDVGSGADALWSLDLSTGTAGAPTSVAQAPIGIAITPDKAPTAAFAASVAGTVATLDASAASDPDGTVATYAWDFGDGQTATGSQPTVSHSYAQPGDHVVTLTVTDDEGCSDALVFTGQTASCAGGTAARVTHTVTVAAAPAPSVPTPPAAPSTPPPPAAPATAQAIERFVLDGPCVPRERDGKARIGLRLVLAKPGSVAVEVHRALIATNPRRCPRRDPARHFDGRLRRVAALEHLATQPAVAASVRRRLTRSFELPPGLYRVSVRAYDPDGGLTRAAYRWVRVLAGPR